MPQFRQTDFHTRTWPDGLRTIPPRDTVDPGEVVYADENPDPHFFELVEDVPKRRTKTEETIEPEAEAAEAQE